MKGIPMMEAKDCRLILTATTECINKCPGCYYSWRETNINTSSRKITEVELFDKFDKFAVGINRHRGYDKDELTLAAELILLGKDVVLTISNRDWESVNLVLRKTNNLHPSALCISVSDNGNIIDNALSLWRKAANVFINVMDTNIGGTDLYNLPTNVIVYLLMEKGPTKLDGSGWKMRDDRIQSYLDRYLELQSMISNTVRLDECVKGIMEDGTGNCSGRWLELDSNWNERMCPYSVDSIDISAVIDYGVPLLECNIPLCR
jgi:hypothetical protein